MLILGSLNGLTLLGGNRCDLSGKCVGAGGFAGRDGPNSLRGALGARPGGLCLRCHAGGALLGWGKPLAEH